LGLVRKVKRVNLGTLCIPFLYPRSWGENVVYLSRGTISCSFGSCNASVKAPHCTPLARTVSITSSTFFNRARWLAFRVLDNFHGVFQRRPPKFTWDGRKAPNIAVVDVAVVHSAVEHQTFRQSAVAELGIHRASPVNAFTLTVAACSQLPTF